MVKVNEDFKVAQAVQSPKMRGNFERHMSLLISFHTVTQLKENNLGELANTFAIIH